MRQNRTHAARRRVSPPRRPVTHRAAAGAMDSGPVFATRDLAGPVRRAMRGDGVMLCGWARLPAR